MANLIGQAFDKYVNKQIKRRQKIQGKSERTLDEIQYLSNRNAWIKLASGVSIEDSRLELLKNKGNTLIGNNKGKKLAQKYVLFNGFTDYSILDKNGVPKVTPREGVKNLNPNDNLPVYGVGSTDFGYSPMPGITDMEFRCLNMGSVKKATLNIKAHNREQFEIIDVLYLRLGYSIFLEWGYDKYIDNDGDLQNMEDTLIDREFWQDKYDNTDYSIWLMKIQEKRKETHGNYDGAFGTISNFSWTFNPDGSYDIKLEIISLGDIIESLKADIPSNGLKSINPYTLKKLQTLRTDLESDDKFEKITQQRFYNDLYPGLETAIEKWYDFVKNETYNKLTNLTVPDGSKVDFGDPNQVLNLNETNVQSQFTFDLTNTSIHLSKFRKIPELFGFDNLQNNVEAAIIPALELGLRDSFNGNQWPNPANPGLSLNLRSNTATEYNKSSNGRGTKLRDVNGNSISIPTTSFGPFKDLFYWIGITSLYLIKEGYDKINTTSFTLGKFKAPTNWDGTFLNPSGIDPQAGDKKDDIYFQRLLFQNSDLDTIKKSVYTYFEGGREAVENADVIAITNTKYLEGSISSSLQAISNLKGTPSNAQRKQTLESFQGVNTVASGRKTSALLDNKLFFNITENPLDAEELDKQNKNSFRVQRFLYRLESGGRDRSGNLIFDGNRVTKISGFDQDDSLRLFWKTTNTDDIVKCTLNKNKYYVRLGYFLEWFQDNVIPKIENTNTPIIKINTNSNNNICYVIDNIIPLDLRKLIFSNKFFIKGIPPSGSPTPSIDPLFSGLNEFMNKLPSEDLYWGSIMNIYFNHDRLREIFSSSSGKDVTLFEVLKAICGDINECLGNINNIQPTVNEDNIIILSEQTPIPGIEKIAKSSGINLANYRLPSQEAILEVYGYNKSNSNNQTSNFVTNIGITTQIDKNYATSITIGATSQGSVPGIEATAFSRWNIGLLDRFKNNIVDATEGTTNSNIPFIDRDTTQDIFIQYNNTIKEEWSLLGLNGDSDHTFNDDIIKLNKSTAANYYKVAQAIISSNTNSNGTPTDYVESSIGFLPFNLKIDMDGISGIKIYNRVKVNTSFLPSNYDKTLDFIITQVNHKLSNNGWITSLETIATLNQE